MEQMVHQVQRIPAFSRGHAQHGWLDSYHSFSFGSYFNPARVQFGALRVLNDDVVAPGMGFDTHAHHNMEIISIPLEGELEHRDNMGNLAVIRQGDIQVMSAGTGIEHSEYNRSKEHQVKFLQIWIFPNEKNVSPRYDQITMSAQDRKNRLQQVVSPHPDDEGVWIHQNAWLHLGKFDQGVSYQYELKDPANGVYAFVLNGHFHIEGQSLNHRDAITVTQATQIDFTAQSDQAEILLIEVPMQL